MYDAFQVLEILNTSGEKEVREAYINKRNFYTERQKSEGYGGQASLELARLEEAYAEALIIVNSRGSGGSLSEAKRLIDEKNPDGAEAELNRCAERNGEWHYLMAQLYYERGWHMESFKEISAAAKSEPDNEMFRKVYEDMENNVFFNGSPDGGKWEKPPEPSYEDPDKKKRRRDCADDCAAYICLDCVCEGCAEGCGSCDCD